MFGDVIQAVDELLQEQFSVCVRDFSRVGSEIQNELSGICANRYDHVCVCTQWGNPVDSIDGQTPRDDSTGLQWKPSSEDSTQIAHIGKYG